MIASSIFILGFLIVVAAIYFFQPLLAAGIFGAALMFLGFALNYRKKPK